MKKVQDKEGFLLDYLKALLYTMVGIVVGVFVPMGILLIGMAFGGRGLNRFLGFIAVGLIIGPLIGLVSGLTASITGFLPGILGQIAGWILLGWIIVLVVGMILRFTGSRR